MERELRNETCHTKTTEIAGASASSRGYTSTVVEGLVKHRGGGNIPLHVFAGPVVFHLGYHSEIASKRGHTWHRPASALQFVTKRAKRNQVTPFGKTAMQTLATKTVKQHPVKLVSD